MKTNSLGRGIKRSYGPFRGLCFGLSMMVILVIALSISGCICQGRAVRAAAKNEAEGQQMLERALSHIDKEEYDAALETSRKIIKSYADLELEARLTMSDIYLMQGKFDQAIDEAVGAYQRAKELYPTDTQRIAEAKAQMTRALIAEETVNRTLQASNVIITSMPGTPRAAAAQRKIAYTYLFYGKKDEAIREFEKTIKDYPYTKEALSALGILCEIFVVSGKPENAEVILPGYVETHIDVEDAPMALKKICRMFWRLGRLDRALATARRIIDTYPESPQTKSAVMYMRRVYVEWEGYDGAVIELREFISAHPDTPAAAYAQYEISGLYKAHAKVEEAVEEYERLFTEYPESPVVTPRLQLKTALWYSKKGRYDVAIPRLQAVISRYPDSKEGAIAHHRLGAIYQRQKKYDQAISEYREVADRNVWSQFSIAECFRAQGKYAQALVEFKKTIRKFPKTRAAIQAKRLIAFCYIGLGRYEEALEALQKIILEYPGTRQAALAQSSIGHLYYHQLKDYKKALEEYQKIIDGYPLEDIGFKHIRENAKRYIEFCKARLKEGR